MLKRKIINKLVEWKNGCSNKALLIKGARQVGKTTIIRQFAQANYENFIEINFEQMPTAKQAFDGNLDARTILINLSAMGFGPLVPGKTLIFFDEIQSCPKARTAIKFLVEDGQYDYIESGSLLGINYKEVSSFPVGFEHELDMYPLDFEEFLWANGISEAIIGKLTACLDSIQPVPEAIHQKMRQLILQYTVVGGMPSVVNTFVNTHNMGRVLAEQRGIVAEYEEDMVKYASDADKPRIRECFESIPRQLSKEYKKFQYSTIRKGAKASQYTGSIQWIEDAGIITRCRNLTITELPLNGNAIDDCFKIYMADTGLFVSMLDDGTQFDIMQGNLHAYKGAIFENLVADIFTKMKRRLYYFRKDSGLEVDFVTRYKGECVLVEVKAKDGNIKSSKTILSHPEKYHVNHAIKLGDLNVGSSGQFLTLPLYMTFLLRQL